MAISRGQRGRTANFNQTHARIQRTSWLIISGCHINASQRQKELMTSEAKSHAARISHARRKGTKLSPGLCRGSTSTEFDEESNIVTTQMSLELLNSPRAIVDDARRDPFQSFSVTLRVEEHELLDTYINACFSVPDPPSSSLTDVELRKAVLRPAS